MKVLEDQLRNNASDEPDLSGITIKFALVVEPRGDVDADNRQATHAVTAATEAVNPLSSTPAAVGLLSSTVNTGTGIATAVQAVETTHVWAVLMERIELLDKIVSGIAEVLGAQFLDPPRSECHSDSPLYVARLVRDISCKQGLSSIQYSGYP